MKTSLLLATYNQGKLAELRGLVADLDIPVIGLSDLPPVPEVEETGTTFAENADLKALGYAVETGRVALADDSGLEVDALGGRPGVLSARYGGDDLDFPAKMAMLLEEMSASGVASRSARFVCAISVAAPDGRVLQRTEGVCAGHIAQAPRGRLGFGYDPVFVPDGFDMTFGELGDAVKNTISHRARAFRQIIPFLGHITSV